MVHGSLIAFLGLLALSSSLADMTSGISTDSGVITRLSKYQEAPLPAHNIIGPLSLQRNVILNLLAGYKVFISAGQMIVLIIPITNIRDYGTLLMWAVIALALEPNILGIRVLP